MLRPDTVRYFIHDGPIKIFERNGEIAETGVVKHHTYGDYWVSYFENGRPLYVRDLKNDTGWATRYYISGRVEDSIYFEGKISSTIKHWYQNGQLESVYMYSHGDYNGLAMKYFPSGKLKATGNFANGKISGEEKFWYEDGKIHTIGHKSNGFLNGRQTVYYENGVIQLEYNAKDDKIDGEIKKRNEDGTLVGDQIYKDGILIENKIDSRTGPFPPQQQAPLN
jgi:antitoxin component YwqK of YwqJK toxin-antitoxin module